VEALSQAAHRRHTVRVDEDVGALRRAVARLAAARPGIRAGEAELVATELATNIVRHAPPGGYVLYRPAGAGIELLAVDRGPGLRPHDGRPPHRGGLGLGLSSVERLASTFDLHSVPGQGTVVLARLGEPARPGPFRWGAVNVPLDGEGESGDGWTVAVDGLLSAVVVDGLGHGPEAHAASAAAMSALRGPLTDLDGFLRRAHQAMLATRGGVIGVCSIDAAGARLTYAGVGNVTGRLLLEGTSRGLLSREGTLGTQSQAPRVHVMEHRWEPGAALVLASDGLRGHWDPRAYPGLLGHDPAVVAATLHRDHERGTDDATVLVVEDTR
jgi:anti-sigma regulatory factor (Ser/Thr protein kinase)